MGGGTQTSTQNTSAEPWPAAQPALKQSIGAASNLASAGAFKPYMGNTVTPWANQTTRGNAGIENLVSKNTGPGTLSSQYQDIINRGGYNVEQSQSVDGIRRIANNANAPSFTQQNLSGIARGDMLDREDPNFERALAAASESAANQINLGASGAGRYGGAIHQGNVAREVGNYEAGQRVNQYNTERANQVNANQAIDSQRMAGMGMGLNANQSMFNAGQQGFSNIGQAYQQAKAPWQDLREVGGYGEDLATRLKNDEIRRFEAQQAAPRQNIEWLSAIGSGAGSLGGTSTATAQQPGQSPFATALGYGSGLASLLGGR